MKIKHLTAAALAGTILTLPAHADHDDRYRSHRIEPRSGHHYDYAKVIGVTPVYRVVRVSEPRRECWEEPVTRYHSAHHGRRHRSAVPVILGGILGGVAGNQFGGGSGKVALTVGGALLGGALAGDIARAHHSYDHTPRSYTSYEERCTTHTSYREEERIDGYRVDYEYRGRVYSTHMDERPGDRIKVSVDVTPARH